ncbi:hypothetical protein FISHEDRAFT_71009 [Fistulina hepatica ATCC 64428]|uniref:Uncharacterized protein n=1 Tax=Fistulina hepatica ATCC 64428 TaxID=1128425 RepID=A0A0D7AI11_9AGAR|nr:hypothetical protein FISHEDRAFT_71009 [Fistulina hepatica ATCC 64428]
MKEHRAAWSAYATKPEESPVSAERSSQQQSFDDVQSRPSALTCAASAPPALASSHYKYSIPENASHSRTSAADHAVQESATPGRLAEDVVAIKPRVVEAASTDPARESPAPDCEEREPFLATSDVFAAQVDVATCSSPLEAVGNLSETLANDQSVVASGSEVLCGIVTGDVTTLADTVLADTPPAGAPADATTTDSVSDGVPSIDARYANAASADTNSATYTESGVPIVVVAVSPSTASSRVDSTTSSNTGDPSTVAIAESISSAATDKSPETDILCANTIDSVHPQTPLSTVIETSLPQDLFSVSNTIVREETDSDNCYSGPLLEDSMNLSSPETSNSEPIASGALLQQSIEVACPLSSVPSNDGVTTSVAFAAPQSAGGFLPPSFPYGWDEELEDDEMDEMYDASDAMILDESYHWAAPSVPNTPDDAYGDVDMHGPYGSCNFYISTHRSGDENMLAGASDHYGPAAMEIDPFDEFNNSCVESAGQTASTQWEVPSPSANCHTMPQVAWQGACTSYAPSPPLSSEMNDCPHGGDTDPDPNVSATNDYSWTVCRGGGESSQAGAHDDRLGDASNLIMPGAGQARTFPSLFDTPLLDSDFQPIDMSGPWYRIETRPAQAGHRFAYTLDGTPSKQKDASHLDERLRGTAYADEISQGSSTKSTCGSDTDDGEADEDSYSQPIAGSSGSTLSCPEYMIVAGFGPSNGPDTSAAYDDYVEPSRFEPVDVLAASASALPSVDEQRDGGHDEYESSHEDSVEAITRHDNADDATSEDLLDYEDVADRASNSSEETDNPPTPEEHLYAEDTTPSLLHEHPTKEMEASAEAFLNSLGFHDYIPRSRQEEESPENVIYTLAGRLQATKI